jgi:predicted phosphoadenosine phosphosulfate sulfurtransferase
MYKYGHWTSPVLIDPEKDFGFVYLISCKITGRSYIGKKQFYSYKKRKKYKESDWKTYISSSDELKEDIRKFKKNNFTFTILGVYKTRGGLVYAEANLQHKHDVLTESDKNGRLWYNKQIGAIKFLPKEFYP